VSASDERAARSVAAPATGGEQQPGQAPLRASVTWSFANKLLIRGVSTLQGLILARILVPRDYGVFAVAQLVVTLGLTINGGGISWALTRWPGDVRRVTATAQTLALASSTVLLAGSYLLAPLFAAAFNTPAATTPIRWLGLCLFIDGVASPSFGLLARRLMQKSLTICEASAAATSIPLTILLAHRGAGIYALVVGRIVATLTHAILAVILCPDRPALGWFADDARELVRVSTPVMTASLVEVALLSVDTVVVGRVLGLTALGFYVIAFNLANFAGLITTSSVTTITTAVFGASPHDFERLAAKGMRHLLTLMIPPTIVQACFASVIISTVYGTRWLPSATTFALLSVMALTRVIVRFLNDATAAVGQPGIVLVHRVIWFVTLIPALALGAHLGGIAGVGGAQLAVSVLVALPLALLFVKKTGVHPWAVAQGAGLPLAAALIAAPTLLLGLLPGSNRLVPAAIAIAAFLLAYAASFHRMLRTRPDDEAPQPRADDHLPA
jgi:PST family polysaccharide transporter